MKLFFIETDNGMQYEDTDSASFVVLAETVDQAKSQVAASKGYGCDWPINILRLLAEDVSWSGMPQTATVLHGKPHCPHCGAPEQEIK